MGQNADMESIDPSGRLDVNEVCTSAEAGCPALRGKIAAAALMDLNAEGEQFTRVVCPKPSRFWQGCVAELVTIDLPLAE